MQLPLGRSLVVIFVLVSSSIFNGCTGVNVSGSSNKISEATNSVTANPQPLLTANSAAVSSFLNSVPDNSSTTTATVVASDLTGSDTTEVGPPPSLNSDGQSASLKLGSSQVDALSPTSTNTTLSSTGSISKRFDRIKVS